MRNIDLSPAAFMEAAFPPEMLNPNETPLLAYPVEWEDSLGLPHTAYRQQAWNPRSAILKQPLGFVFGVSTVQRKEKLQRRGRDLRHVFVLPCDDIGTKADRPPVKPSYILETSPGNCQWGYFIDPLYVGPDGSCSHAVAFDACLLGLANAGYNDPGCRGAARVVKLPGAVHKSGFITRCLAWEPERSWPLTELMAQMGVAPAAVAPQRNRARGSVTRLDLVDDPVWDFLEVRGLVRQVNARHYGEIRCPWAENHTDPARDAAGYSPLDFGLEGRQFKCLHGSCARRNTRAFLAWVRSCGGPRVNVSSYTPDMEVLKCLPK